MEYFALGALISMWIMAHSYTIPYFIRKGWNAAGKHKEPSNDHTE